MIQQGLPAEKPKGYKSKTHHLFDAIKELVEAKVNKAVQEIKDSPGDSMFGEDFGRADKAEENLLKMLKKCLGD